ncbi:MAG: YibE/F family protein [Candidatus Buchananbacteria bacterium]|nr:YibE/F family protein [Candidatus Buchananbacteria bacterium]
MSNKIIVVIFFIALLLPAVIFAQEEQNIGNEVFEAKVIRILEQTEIEREGGSKAIQQNILLLGLTGEWKNKEIKYEGISDLDVVGNNTYKAGDKVLVQRSITSENEDKFYIVDFVRRGYLYLLAFIFALVIVAVGKIKGLKALISLAVSFLIIIKLILPQILSGTSPLLVGVLGSFAILVVMIYLTEGLNKKSHLAIVSVLFSLVITMALSIIFTSLTRLTGLAQEESTFLIGIGQQAIDFRGLLLAGMLIGTIGVLDDVIVGQIEAVQQIKEANPNLSSGAVFKMSYQVGNAHLGAIINTLFLIYAGASLPLLLLFTIHQEPFLSFNQVINNEIIATEIVRSLVGSIGVAMSLPISTYLASYYLKLKK